ncbi:MAG: hypothetical protein DRO23_10395 [Thermoprotei archaeon]|nr:MAG: hypothetical protein DRO23_10395 [Thermoprotei archaeon]
MVKFRVIIIAITLVMLLLLATSLYHEEQKPRMVNKDLARKFLETQYVPEAGLLRAATLEEVEDSHKIYVAADNLLAARALAVLGSPLASNVLTTLNNKYGGAFDKLHEILLGEDIPDVFYQRYVEYLGNVSSSKFGILEIYYEEPGETPIDNWDRYANLVVYKALKALLHGSRSYAEQLFSILISMWDGYGFKDEAYNGSYETYKVALAIYLYKALEEADSSLVGKYRDLYEKWNMVLALMQRSDGGIVTHYKVSERGEIIPVGDANTETTSITILALYSKYPKKIGEYCKCN